jgi:NDP-sugar pyrophosphorylase family protein
VELGTIIIAGASHPRTPGQRLGTHAHISPPDSDHPVALWDVLGKSVLQRTVDRLRALGTQLVTVASGQGAATANGTTEPWERAFLDYVRNGAERVLVISAGIYSEVDFSDLLKFHRGSGSQVANVVDDQGPLGIFVIEAKCADGDLQSFRNRLAAFASCSSSYEFNGYSNRLNGIQDYRSLVRDALAGRSQIKPVGRETAPGVWCGAGARVSTAAQIFGPAYIGCRTRIRAGALVTSGTSIEQRSEVDCGTVVENSSILPRTYLGPGLHVSQSVVSGSRLVHLGRNIDVELADTGLLGRTGPSTPVRVLQTLGSFLGAFGSQSKIGASTSSRTPASVDWARSNGFFD